MSAFFAQLERDFCRVLAQTPKPDPIPEPETVDCTGVQIGNSDIPTPEWNPPQGEPERPTLPGHEHTPNLPHLEGM